MFKNSELCFGRKFHGGEIAGIEGSANTPGGVGKILAVTVRKPDGKKERIPLR